MRRRGWLWLWWWWWWWWCWCGGRGDEGRRMYLSSWDSDAAGSWSRLAERAVPRGVVTFQWRDRSMPMMESPSSHCGTPWKLMLIASTGVASPTVSSLSWLGITRELYIHTHTTHTAIHSDSKCSAGTHKRKRMEGGWSCGVKMHTYPCIWSCVCVVCTLADACTLTHIHLFHDDINVW